MLLEIERRKKVGGITDRRFGEDDPTLTPEEKALQRFVREKQRGSKKDAIFDLEDGESPDSLTHFGQALDFTSSIALDDFNEADVEDSDSKESRGSTEAARKIRRRDPSDEALHGTSERPKSKHEVMKEVIAKSKLHKYERQQTKEDDDELRAELDKGLPDLFALLNDARPARSQDHAADTRDEAQVATMNADRLALLHGKDRIQADQQYDQRLRQMAMDQRAKPTMRTLPEEEKIRLESQRLREMEEARLKRMRASREDSGSERSSSVKINENADDDSDHEGDVFGLGKGLADRQTVQGLAIEDEDEFLIDEDLVASASEAKSTDSESQSLSDEELADDADPALVHDLITQEDRGRDGLSFAVSADGAPEARKFDGGLAYTYPCPQTLEEMLSLTQVIQFEAIPMVVQRIRILYQPQLATQNKLCLERFTAVLVAYIAHVANRSDHPPFAVIEALIRHIHSLAKTFPEEAARAFRDHLRDLSIDRSTSPNAGDLVIFTAIGSIFPTSDHFHQVVTPAMLCMTQYLGQKIPSSLSDLAIGAYICSLCLHFQILSMRYIPEVVNYVLNALNGLMPQRCDSLNTLVHNLPSHLRMNLGILNDVVAKERPSFWDVLPRESMTTSQRQSLICALLSSQFALIDAMSHTWAEKSAFCEMLRPICDTLGGMMKGPCHKSLPEWLKEEIEHSYEKLHQQLEDSFKTRKSLCLHHHRPLAIKSSIPKFEDSYNPDKHYDPDRDRAEMSKLKAEHKRERKGALRELRKDASFIARESLREKKEKDSAYEKKYKRLVAEIQGEEGREAKSYEREKRARKSKSKR